METEEKISNKLNAVDEERKFVSKGLVDSEPQSWLRAAILFNFV